MVEIACFGIRHHGPGSARRLVQALDRLQPRQVLIEGPSDLSDLMPALVHPSASPPLALLSYVEEDSSRASFWPFDVYSPEYQAIRWAVAKGAALRFIDLPSSVKLAEWFFLSYRLDGFLFPAPTCLVGIHHDDWSSSVSIIIILAVSSKSKMMAPCWWCRSSRDGT